MVADTAVEATPGGSLKFPPPHAIVKQLRIKIENNKNGCSGARYFITYFIPLRDVSRAGETALTQTRWMLRLRDIIPQNLKMPSDNFSK
ncbi:MAG: hypothetical protein WBV55_06535 [Candidatus Sulfotelmatobacter sp.]